SDRRSARDQHPRPRELPSPFVHRARGLRLALRFRHRGLPPRDPGPCRQARHQAQSLTLPLHTEHSDQNMARQPDDKAAVKFSSEDSALVRELALLLDETSLTEIEIERAGLRLRVARNISVAATMPMPMAHAAHMPVAAASAAAAPAAPAADLSKHPGAVTSPMVGTAYWA